MDFNFDILGYLTQLLSEVPADPFGAAWWLLVHGGFLAILLPGLYALATWWKHERRRKYLHGITYQLLAIDVPKDSEQSPQAVEQIFGALSATRVNPSFMDRWWDRWWTGKSQESFSFEIVSLGGYIQFLIRTPADYRDLIESAIYAQYPNAEITEVEDYVGRIPTDFDTETYDLWGTEFALMKPWVYPVKTYPEFEHKLSRDFKDPMAQLLEVLGRVGADEDIWLQLLVTPIDDSWKEESAELVRKMVEGEKAKAHGLIYWLLFQLPARGAYDIFEAVIAGVVEPSGTGESESGEKKDSGVTKLTPGQNIVVEAIERKASKIGFRVKFRLVYWGRRETFLKGRGVAAVVGAIQQFTTLNLNGFKPSKLVTTKAGIFPKQSRITRKQRSILRAYARRRAYAGVGRGVVLNTEELATLYHFPVLTVKAPLVKKIADKKAEPPLALPVFRVGGYLPKVAGAEATPAMPGGVKGAAPMNVPIVE